MGPGIATGEHAFLPFTVDMAFLFQEYVVSCLRRHVTSGFRVSRQYSVEPAGDFRVTFSMDAVVRQEGTGSVLAVVDAKYKKDQRPSSDDIEQVIAYATQTGASQAFLVYPFALPAVRHIAVGTRGQLKVSAVGFALDSDLEQTARAFASQIFTECAS
jgi:5-methylcytosine-specific restriction enzyme subunit McrC